MPPSAKQIKALTSKITSQSTTRKVALREERLDKYISPEEKGDKKPVSKGLDHNDRRAQAVMSQVAASRFSSGFSDLGYVSYNGKMWEIGVPHGVNTPARVQMFEKIAAANGLKIQWFGSKMGPQAGGKLVDA